MDDLTKIKGVGAASARKLKAAGIDTFAAMALANPADEPLASIAKSDIEAVAWITAAAKLATVPVSQGETVSQEKPLGSDLSPEAHLQDRAGLPADSRTGDRQPGVSDIPPKSDRREGAGNSAGPATGTTSSDGVFSFGEDEWANVGLDFWQQALSSEQAMDAYPLLREALENWQGAGVPAHLVISAKRDGFRRGGIAHTRAEMPHAIHSLTPDQIEQMLGGPALTVRLA